ncbi:MAG: ATP-binding protein [Spirochaetes bacterium]|nr:ATP-binding protein [Spirochaetota bacterium]
MFHRILKPSNNNSYFLFGARGTGKTTLLHSLFKSGNELFIDLLDAAEADNFLRNPSELTARVAALPDKNLWIIIDEIQKVPALLDIVHKLIESSGYKFILTGSSARKLKRGESNLLAGRAFVYNLFPLTCTELGKEFDLQHALQWGTLPGIFQYSDPEDKAQYLRAYSLTYLKEEIVSEQIIRKLQPFRQFLEVAAQTNGKIINYAKIAEDVGVDTKTVQSYYSILEETLVGILLAPYSKSVRKRQRSNPKFYFFDPGVKRALDRTLGIDLKEGTYAYGNAFEHFIILEIFRLSSYKNNDWTFSYLCTKDNVEIDLVIDRPGLPAALIEIKSASNITERDAAALDRLSRDIPDSEAFCFSRDPNEKKIGAVRCIDWKSGLAALGLD